MSLRKAAQQALEALENDPVLQNANNNATAWLRAALADTQDWDEIEALRASLREHMAEIKRLNECLTWEQHRSEHVGTHGPGCAEWGPKHYECLLLAHKALKERTHREDRTVGATIKDCLIVEPVAYVTGYFDGKCVIKPIEHVALPTGMALYRSPPKREPLTDEQIQECVAKVDDARLAGPITALIRAAERKLGIGDEG